MVPKHAFRRRAHKRPERSKLSASKAKPDHADESVTGVPRLNYDDMVIKWAPLAVPLLAVMLVVTVYLGVGTVLSYT